MTKVFAKPIACMIGSVAVFYLLILGLTAATKVAFGKPAIAQVAHQRILKVIDAQPHGLEIVSVQELDSADFPRGFSVEIKNVSAKPIYYLSFPVCLSGSEKILGKRGCFRMRFGDPRLLDKVNMPTKADIPILPGKTATIVADHSYVAHIQNFIRDNKGANGILGNELVIRGFLKRVGDEATSDEQSGGTIEK